MAKGSGGSRSSSWRDSHPKIDFPQYAFGRSLSQIGGPEVRRILSENFGDSESDIDAAQQLLDMHSDGGARQSMYDEQIYQLINDKSSPVGKVLRDMAAVNTEHYRRQMALQKSRIEADVEDMFFFERMYAPRDYTDDQVRQRIREDLVRATKIMVYRGGDRKNTESWTRDSRGASVGSGMRIRVDHRSSIDDLLKTHYMVAGISQMVGAPGEAEVLFVRKKRR